jgi:hypothetical protein
MNFEFSSQIASPGLGVTPVNLSAEPLATEGEATHGPDEEVDWDELESAGLGGVDFPQPELDSRDFPESGFAFEPMDFDESEFGFDVPEFER